MRSPLLQAAHHPTSSSLVHLLQAQSSFAMLQMQQPAGNPSPCFQPHLPQGTHLVQGTRIPSPAAAHDLSLRPSCAHFQAGFPSLSHDEPAGSPNPNPNPLIRVPLPGSSEEMFMTVEAANAYFKRLHPECGHCGSTDNHFRYFNNKARSSAAGKTQQPRYDCNNCHQGFQFKGKTRKRKGSPASGDDDGEHEFQGQPEAREIKKRKGKSKLQNDFLINGSSVQYDSMHAQYALTSQGALPYAGYAFLQNANEQYHQCPTQMQVQYGGGSSNSMGTTCDSMPKLAASTSTLPSSNKPVHSNHLQGLFKELESFLLNEQAYASPPAPTFDQHASSQGLCNYHPTIFDHQPAPGIVPTYNPLHHIPNSITQQDDCPASASLSQHIQGNAKIVEEHSKNDLEKLFEELGSLLVNEPVCTSPPAPAFDQLAYAQGLINYHPATFDHQPAPALGIVPTYSPHHQISNSITQQDDCPSSALLSQHIQGNDKIAEHDAPPQLVINAQLVVDVDKIAELENVDRNDETQLFDEYLLADSGHVDASSENVELITGDSHSSHPHASEVLKPPCNEHEQQQQQFDDKSPHLSPAMHKSSAQVSNSGDIAAHADKHANVKSPAPAAPEPNLALPRHLLESRVAEQPEACGDSTLGDIDPTIYDELSGLWNDLSELSQEEAAADEDGLAKPPLDEAFLDNLLMSFT